jgi:quercetin dioxygenase-like cupin family protein
METNLEALKELTKRLPDLVTLSSSTVRYEVDQGQCVGVNLRFGMQIAVQDAYMSGGATFPVHSHSGIEHLIVYEGRIRIEEDGIGREIGVGESCVFPSGVKHTVLAIEDTWMIGITIPADEGYPHAAKRY